MKTHTAVELKEVIARHMAYLKGESGGERADLSYANLSNADLSYANLSYACLNNANLNNANLSNANLRYADLSNACLNNANLSYADLSYACLSYATGNGRELKSIAASSQYAIAYTSIELVIGCERHLISDWFSFDDARILEMDGRDALKFWRVWKPLLQQLIDAEPATPTRELTS